MDYSILTYCSTAYQPAFRTCIGSWLDSRATRVYVYCDGPVDLNRSKRVEVRPVFAKQANESEHRARRAESLLDHLNTPSCLDQNIVLVDADCWIARELGKTFAMDFDVAVTLPSNDAESLVTPQNFRGKPCDMLRDICPGVILAKRTASTKLFLRQWIDDQESSVEQARFNRCSVSRSRAALTKIVRRHHENSPVKLATLNAEVFNSHPQSGYPADISRWITQLCRNAPKTRILHFAHGLWKDHDLMDEALENV